MALCIPRVASLVSEWTSELLIEGAVHGARVSVRVGSPSGRLVVDAVVSGGADLVSLLPGERLYANEVLTVSQREGDESSPWTDPALGAVVGAVPSSHDQVAPPGFVSRLFDFSQRIWVGGTVPGAQVNVAQDSLSIGSGRAAPEGARLALTSVMRANRSVSAIQAAPPGHPPLTGAPKAIKALVQPLPVPFGQRLPVPQLAGPAPLGCDPAIPVGNIVDGAEVTVNRITEGAVERAPFDAERLWFSLAKPLASGGGVVEITQHFDTQRETFPSLPLSVPFGPANTPLVPVVGALCAGASAVLVSDLSAGSLVTITVSPLGGQPVTYRGVPPPQASAAVFEISPVPVDATVTVSQERCSLVSPIGSVTVTEAKTVTACKLAEPLFECARVVRVMDAHVGARVRVWSRDPDGKRRIIAERPAIEASSVQLAIAPYLASSQTVWVEQYACVGPWLGSDEYSVDAAPPIAPPSINVAPIQGAMSVSVDAVPGAFVEVFAHQRDGRTELIGWGYLDPVVQWIPLVRALKLETVFARQWLCHEVSHPGRAEDVRPGERTFTLPKAKPRIVVSKDVEWKSGVLTVRHNGSWEFTISAENKDTKGDVDIDFQVTLAVNNPKFGAVVPCPLGSPGNDVGAKYGRINQGHQPAASKTRPGHFNDFQKPAYWLEVLNTTAKFEWFVAVKDYSLPKPKGEKKPNESSPKG